MTELRIVITEDDAIIALDIERQVAAMGHTVVGVAATAEEALRIVEERQPDLVLLDIRLKGAVDGIAVAEEIQRRFSTPIIFITAYSDKSVIERAEAVQPQGYLVKPIRKEDLAEAIGQVRTR
ncbi:hypothetical protein ABH15_12370 [Methanoculleus taiwanensis]|uniref:Response regulatory domain-containing protein n=1 Tax=Methanoculleus taiwanensis TaxID=1550565 RepID=A0A498GY56_9EURY|nr:response regulator [Methanoculleus taiwanensis]RXE55502.1 hypothetical protein ABH15_12370 [Methanoculleus taiwanensis]